MTFWKWALGEPPEAVANQIASSSKRPDGSQSMFWGGLAIAIGLILLMFALGGDEIGTSWNLIMMGGGLTQLGLIFWLAGYIVKAISFIPGKGE